MLIFKISAVMYRTEINFEHNLSILKDKSMLNIGGRSRSFIFIIFVNNFLFVAFPCGKYSHTKLQNYQNQSSSLQGSLTARYQVTKGSSQSTSVFQNPY